MKRVYATFNGQNTDLVKDAAQPNVYTGNVPSPFIEGSENVTMNLWVTGIDGRDNAATTMSSVTSEKLSKNCPTAWKFSGACRHNTSSASARSNARESDGATPESAPAAARSEQ